MKRKAERTTLGLLQVGETSEGRSIKIQFLDFNSFNETFIER